MLDFKPFAVRYKHDDPTGGCGDQDLKNEMDQLVGRINGRFSTSTWAPIRYRYGCVSQAELAGLYR